jgi:uncharacterized membrane protein
MADNQAGAGTGLQPNVAGLLCYLLWWVTGLIFLILEKEDKSVRFHAMQSIVVFGVITVILIILITLSSIPVIGLILAILSWIVWLLSVVLWIVLMVKAYQGQMYKLPVAGDIAEKQAK